MTEEVFVHSSDGSMVSLFDVPGTKVTRKKDLPYTVHTHFPVGEVKTVTKPCGNMNLRQDPDKEYCHVWVEQHIERQIHEAYCFHPYRETLEIVEE